MKWYLLALTIINRLILLAQPNVDFYADKTTIYVGDTITFYNTSTNYYAPGSIVAWTFEGGEGDQSKNVDTVKVVYNAPGLFDVTLYINDLSSDAETTKVDYITVLEVSTKIDNKLKLLNNSLVFQKIGKNNYQIEFEGNSNKNTPVELNIYSLSGSLVFNQRSSDLKAKFNLELFNSGIYIVQVTSRKELIACTKIKLE